MSPCSIFVRLCEGRSFGSWHEAICPFVLAARQGDELHPARRYTQRGDQCRRGVELLAQRQILSGFGKLTTRLFQRNHEFALRLSIVSRQSQYYSQVVV